MKSGGKFALFIGLSGTERDEADDMLRIVIRHGNPSTNTLSEHMISSKSSKYGLEKNVADGVRGSIKAGTEGVEKGVLRLGAVVTFAFFNICLQ